MATRQLLEKNNTITALLCHSPDAMIGSISGIHQVGRTVGKDVFLTQQVALIGFEDMLHVNLTSPSFTYVCQRRDRPPGGRADDPQAERAGSANAAHYPLRAAYRAGIGVKSEFSTGLLRRICCYIPMICHG